MQLNTRKENTKMSKVYDDTGRHDLNKATNIVDYILKYINNTSKNCYDEKARYPKDSCEAAYWEGYKTGLKDLQTKLMNKWEDA